MILRRRKLATGRAFTLLEVILALAILSGALAVLGELLRLGLRNAKQARDLTRATVLCESKLAEVMAGLLLPQPVANSVCETDANWVYSIEFQNIDQQGTISVRVTVAPAESTEANPTTCSLVRWMQDPGVLEQEAADAEAAASASSSSSSGT